mmetsp:Transcript_49042/g.114729  ORF Transcript_49042/g.114729 Transcript_49042/m.114729 type:complete len:237 (-) Transcript_49042:295-1005(-)
MCLRADGLRSSSPTTALISSCPGATDPRFRLPNEDRVPCSCSDEICSKPSGPVASSASPDRGTERFRCRPCGSTSGPTSSSASPSSSSSSALSSFSSSSSSSSSVPLSSTSLCHAVKHSSKIHRFCTIGDSMAKTFDCAATPSLLTLSLLALCRLEVGSGKSGSLSASSSTWACMACKACVACAAASSSSSAFLSPSLSIASFRLDACSCSLTVATSDVDSEAEALAVSSFSRLAK